MPLGKDALAKIEAAPSAVDSFKATLDGLAQNQTISKEIAGLVGLALDGEREAIEAALVANVHN